MRESDLLVDDFRDFSIESSFGNHILFLNILAKLRLSCFEANEAFVEIAELSSRSFYLNSNCNVPHSPVRLSRNFSSLTIFSLKLVMLGPTLLEVGGPCNL